MIAKLFNQSAIPPRFMNSAFDNYVADTEEKLYIKNKLQQFAVNIDNNLKLGRNLILAGNAGTGKSHLSVAIAKFAIDNGHTTLFTTVGMMLDKINGGDWHKGTIIENYTVPDLLILDEATSGLNSVEQANLFKVINRRYELMKSTIILTNLSMDELKTVLGERITDRLRDNNGIALYFTWKSYRK